MPTFKQAQPATAAFPDLMGSWTSALSALGQTSGSSSKTVEAFLGSWTAAFQASQALSSFLLTNGKKTFEEQVAAATAISRAKSAQEAFELQTAFAQQAMAEGATNLRKFTDLLAGGVQDSLRPLSARLTEGLAEVKAAA
ncbi:MAG: phasin family protein [Phenylobacterium sp.]|nr:phasin family protein [Phenylobacterium sp.]